VTLDNQALAGWNLMPAEGNRLLSFQSASGFELIHSRNWRVMVDRHDVTILRLIERGDLLAQCNASVLPDVKAGQQLTLESFQTDVQRALGESFGQVEEASQQMTEDGVRVLRAVVSGIVSEIPIQWTYYHLSNAKGQQAAIVFTLEAKLVEQFAGQDQTLVSSFQFRPSAALADPLDELLPATTNTFLRSSQ
jgi:hypothetical protein